MICMIWNIILKMLIFRGTLDEDFHWTGEVTLCHLMQDFPYKDQVLVQRQGEEGRLLPAAIVLHPRDDGHHYGLCQTNNQQHAFRGCHLSLSSKSIQSIEGGPSYIIIIQINSINWRWGAQWVCGLVLVWFRPSSFLPNTFCLYSAGKNMKTQ